MAKFSVRKPLTVFVAVLAVLILGIVSVTRMTPDLLPNMNFPYVIIMTTYPGASPETVEEEITKPLEQSMATLEHINAVTSTSAENYSLVMLEFAEEVNMDTVGVDIQQNIASLSGSWSDTVGTPYVLKINPSMLPVAVTAVSMEGMDVIELTDFLEKTLLMELEGTPGVARISTSGAVERQVHVVISQDKIEALNERMEAAVTKQLDDARAELEETKAELEDAKSELEDAEDQLDSGKETLLSQTSAAEAEISAQQIAALEGKVQLQQQLVSLTQTKTELETQLTALEPIAAQIGELEAAKAELDAQIPQLETQLEETTVAIEALKTQLAALEETTAAIDAQLPEAELRVENAQSAVDSYGDVPPMEGEEGYEAWLAALDELTAAQEALAALNAQKTEAALAQGELAAQLAALEVALPQLQAGLETARATLATVEGGLAAIDAQLAAQDMTRETLSSTVTQIKDGIAQTDAGIAQIESMIDQVESGSLQLNDALETLSESTSAGLLELADAAAQITMNTATLENALTQVEDGLEQLDESRADALASAKLSGSLTLETVSSLLGAQNFAMPAGYVEQEGIRYMVSVGDLIEDVEELENLLLFDTGEDAIGPIYLADAADIFVTDNSEDSYAKLNGSDSVMLSFEKQSNAATADVCDELEESFARLEEEYPGLEFVSMMDQGSYIWMIIASILESLLAGALFSVLILFLFLRDIRPTVITLISIPMSVMFAFVLMYFSGVTMNMISMSGLAVAVGMLVDNSIVVIENIYRLRAKGATPVQAAVAGTTQVAGAITSSTLTTVCVFLPIVFVDGLTRQLFTDLALTMGYSLMASLIIALTLVPAMAKGLLKDRRKKRGRREKSVPAGITGEGPFYNFYRKSVDWSLNHKWLVLLLAVVLLFTSGFAAVNRGFSFMPEIDMNSVTLTAVMPEDATMDEAADIADEIMARAARVDHVESVGATMGSTSLLGDSSSLNVTFYVTLPEGCSGAEAGKAIASQCADLPCELTYNSEMMDMSLLTGSGVSLNLYGNNMEDLQKAAALAADTLAGVEGLEQVSDGLEEAEDAIHVAVDKNAAMAKGWTVAQIYMEIAEALTNSATVLTMDVESTTADVMVETQETLTLDELAALSFEYTDSEGETAEFRLDEVAELEHTLSLTSISRSDQRRQLTVSAAVAEGYNVTKVTALAEEAMAAVTLPESVSYAFSGENETIMEAVSQLLLMLLLGMVLVYFVMVAQFQSLKSPFIVMFTIPLAFTGGFLALLLFGMDVSIISLIGFVMLTGIIVNNGIVLIDYVNQLRAEGLSRREALIEAGATRLRPILMTSLTTILGLVVMAIGSDPGTALMQPVAVVCIGGLLYATIMTLFVIPCIYDMMNKKAVEVLTDEDMEFIE